MQPLMHDIRRCYRKHISGEEISETGVVTPIYKVDGPYALAFRPGGAVRTHGDAGYTYEQTMYFVIADGCFCFEPGDILTSDSKGKDGLYKVDTVKTFPTEQTMYVKGL